jgi:excisionase family DNA binding protein
VPNRSPTTGTTDATIAAAPVADDPDRCLSFREGCAFLGIKRRKGWEMVNAGELPHLRVGRLIRFRRSRLVEWCAEREKGGRR